MDDKSAFNLLQTLVEYFETGSNESDRAAKTIIEWDFELLADRQSEIQNLRDAGEWSGLRAPEADFIASGLRLIQEHLRGKI